MYFKDSSWVTEGLQLFDSLCEITGSHNRGQSWWPTSMVGCQQPLTYWTLTALTISVWEVCLLPTSGVIFCVVCIGEDDGSFLDIEDVKKEKVKRQTQIFKRIIFSVWVWPEGSDGGAEGEREVGGDLPDESQSVQEVDNTVGGRGRLTEADRNGDQQSKFWYQTLPWVILEDKFLF